MTKLLQQKIVRKKNKQKIKRDWRDTVTSSNAWTLLGSWLKQTMFELFPNYGKIMNPDWIFANCKESFSSDVTMVLWFYLRKSYILEVRTEIFTDEIIWCLEFASKQSGAEGRSGRYKKTWLTISW